MTDPTRSITDRVDPDRTVGYVVSRFPKTTETFIVREMEAVRRRGWRIAPFAIFRERDQILQPGAERYLDDLLAISDLSVGRAIVAQARLLRRSPSIWFDMWRRAIVGNIGSRKFLLRAVVCAWGAPALADHAVEVGVGHLHAHWGTHSALLAHLMAAVSGLPYSITLHAHDLHVDQTMLAEKLAASSAVVTISDHNADIVRSRYPDVADRTQVIRCGVDLSEVDAIAAEVDAPTSTPAGERADGELRIACVAGLRGFKGHIHLLGAVRLLEERGHRVRCDLVGDGPLREELVAAAPGSVVFHGAVDVREGLRIVSGSDVVAMPSVELADGRRDGIPVALMEAMALGVPVVATTVSGIPELVRDGRTGKLVPPEDAVALADAIEALWLDPAGRERFARYARDLVEQEFDIEITGRRMSDVFAPARHESGR